MPEWTEIDQPSAPYCPGTGWAQRGCWGVRVTVTPTRSGFFIVTERQFDLGDTLDDSWLMADGAWLAAPVASEGLERSEGAGAMATASVLVIESGCHRPRAEFLA